MGLNIFKIQVIPYTKYSVALFYNFVVLQDIGRHTAVQLIAEVTG
jgi:hypothetical protein